MIEWLDVDGGNPGTEGAREGEAPKSEYKLLSNSQLTQNCAYAGQTA